MKGRFQIDDMDIAVVMIGGSVLAAMSTELDALESGEGSGAAPFYRERIAERTCSAILRTLGIPPGEAEEIANRPVPDVDFPPQAG